MRDLMDRVAVVTGAATGMGRSIALSLAEEGVDIVISDIDEDIAQTTAEEVRALGRRSIAVTTDVAQLASVKALADRSFLEFGKVDILVNNAGVNLRPFRAVWDVSEEDFRWVVGVNLMGVFNGVSAFVPRMREQPGEKHIVNTSSMGTLVTVPGNSAYAASKTAVTGFSEVIREELEPDNFGVTVLFPGYVKTRVGTSERLRPENERSEGRNITPFSELAAKRKGPDYQQSESIAGAVELKDGADMIKGIEPDLVGPMVVKAIRRNAPYCMTHPTPAEALRRHAEALIASYVVD
jgi:NAD(P)-dependent dehydrogenase (short-subunit alcohol dehydrogenase family)